MEYHAERAAILTRTLRREINAARREHGREALTHSDELGAIASDYATTLRYADVFDHTQDGDPTDRAPRYRDVRENLHRETGGRFDADATATRAVGAWLDSPGHRENLLAPGMRLSGVGVATTTTSAYMVHVLAAGKSTGAAVRDTVAQLNPL